MIIVEVRSLSELTVVFSGTHHGHSNDPTGLLPSGDEIRESY